MAQQIINVGAEANTRTGDTWRNAMIKTNENFTEVYDLTSFNKRVLVNTLDDLPAPSGGVYTLLDNFTYLISDDLNIGNDRFALGQRTVVTGNESLNITLSYTGTGDMFTMVNSTNRINNLTLSAPNGRWFNWSSSSGEQLRVQDIQGECDRLGTFTGSSSLLRFTNISPTMSTSGLTFNGSWTSLLWEVSGATVNGGTFFNLGTATFLSILINETLMTLASGTTFLSGLASSGNITVGGLGAVHLIRTFGAGTVLSGVSIDDVRWDFFHNNDIEDTLRDCLIYSSSSLTTTISVAETYVKVNATWAEETASGFSSDSTGKITWNGEKDIKVPVDMSLSVAPSTGTNKTIRTRLALNGTTLANSTRSTRTDAGDASSVTTPWQITFAPGDYIEAFVTSADATDVVVSGGIMRVN